MHDLWHKYSEGQIFSYRLDKVILNAQVQWRLVKMLREISQLWCERFIRKIFIKEPAQVYHSNLDGTLDDVLLFYFL